MTEPQPELPSGPPSSAGRLDYPLLLAHALRRSDWRSPQLILLGKVVCRSPDPLTVTRVGRWEVWHREVRAAILNLPEGPQRAIWSYLRRDPVLEVRAGQLVSLPVPIGPEEVTAFEVLWRALVAGNCLHRLTRATPVAGGDPPQSGEGGTTATHAEV